MRCSGHRDADDRTLLSRLAQVLEPRGKIFEADLFGSTARESRQLHSDLDVAVYLADPRPKNLALRVHRRPLGGTHARGEDPERRRRHPQRRAAAPLPSRPARRSADPRPRPPGHDHPRGAALSRYCDYVPQLAKIEAAHRARIEAARFGL
ncbi:MAG: nucleotidyltransferase domain-containing protein [Candidatus Rokuibacteriota bacterium]